MERIVVLDSAVLGDDSFFDVLQSFGTLTVYKKTSLEERIDHIGNATIVVTNNVKIDKFVLDSCPSIRLVSIIATGMNNVDLDYAKQKNVVVKNVAGYSTETVVQHTFTLLFGLLRRVEFYSRYVKSKEYSSQNFFTHFYPGGIRIARGTWGIIGLGTIGRRVAEVATAFGCKVIYYSTSGKNHTSDYEEVSLEKLLQESDFVSIHSPLNAETLNLIGEKDFKQMKQTSYLINVGRGGIVDEVALAQALKHNQIAGAALDVLQKEPLPIDSPLLDDDIQDKIFITPHIAWFSDVALEELKRLTIENVRTFLE